MTGSISHNEAVKRALLQASRCGAMVFRRDVGMFLDQRGNNRRVGFPGEPDISGIIPGGRAIGIEVKSQNASPKPHQKRWADRFISLGGLYILARYNDREDGDQTIRNAIQSALSSNAGS